MMIGGNSREENAARRRERPAAGSSVPGNGAGRARAAAREQWNDAEGRERLHAYTGLLSPVHLDVLFDPRSPDPFQGKVEHLTTGRAHRNARTPHLHYHREVSGSNFTAAPSNPLTPP
jgi:hypothetical protein